MTALWVVTRTSLQPQRGDEYWQGPDRPLAWSGDPAEATRYATRNEVVEALRDAFANRPPHSIRIERKH